GGRGRVGVLWDYDNRPPRLQDRGLWPAGFWQGVLGGRVCHCLAAPATPAPLLAQAGRPGSGARNHLCYPVPRGRHCPGESALAAARRCGYSCAPLTLRRVVLDALRGLGYREFLAAVRGTACVPCAPTESTTPMTNPTTRSYRWLFWTLALLGCCVD